MPRVVIISIASLSYIYCLGYVSFFGYFGWIVGDIWWIDIPAKDLLVRGAFAILLTKAWIGFVLFVAFLFSAFFYKEIKVFYGRCLTHKVFREWVVWGAVFAGVTSGTVSAMPGSLLEIAGNEKVNVSRMMNDSGIDSVCLSEGECVDAKVLYSNGDVYVLYVGDFEDGEIRVLKRSLVDYVDLGWSKNGRNEIESLLDKSGS